MLADIAERGALPANISAKDAFSGCAIYHILRMEGRWEISTRLSPLNVMGGTLGEGVCNRERRAE